MPETPGATYQDIPLMADMYCARPRITVVKEHLVHYRYEIGQNNSMQANGPKLIQMATNSYLAAEIIERNQLLSKLVDGMLAHAVIKNRACYYRIGQEWKAPYAAELTKLFCKLCAVKPMEDNIFLSESDRNFVRHFVHT